MSYNIISKTQDANGYRSLLATIDNRAEAREFAKANNGLVKTDAEIIAYQMAKVGPVEAALDAPITPERAVEISTFVDTLPVVPVADTNGFIALAAGIAKAPRAGKLVNQKDKVAKRETTPAETIDRAVEAIRVAIPSGLTKVHAVRLLALFEEKVLQRRDVFAVFKQLGDEYPIADHTISTQYQFALKHNKL